MNKPFIYLAFAAEPHNNQDHLYSVEEEEMKIRFKLIAYKVAELLDYDAWNKVTGKKLLKSLPNFEYSLSIFHFSGHANSVDLAFADANYSVEQLTTMLGDFPNLKLVVLNGCSTKGFVQKLHRAGVKAVIATSEKIGDKPATEFADHFYHLLAIAKQSLRRAFELATNIDNEDTSHIYRDLGDEEEEEGTGEFPWGLYINKSLSNAEQQELLNWRLIPDIHRMGLMPASSKEAILKMVALQEAFQEKLPEKRNQLKRAELLEELAELKTDPAKKKAIQEDAEGLRQATKKWFDEKENDIRALYAQISSQAQQDRDRAIKEQVRSYLEKLNFIPQMDEFNEAVVGSPSRNHAFIIRGTPVCGHEILVKRLLQIAEIDHENTYTQIEVSFAAHSQTAPSGFNIWSKIQLAMNRLATYVESDEPAKVMDGLLERYFVPNHLVFIFKDVYPTVALNISIIKEFWENFLTILQKKKKEKNMVATGMAHRALLFVLDKNCPLDGNRQSIKDPKYLELITEQQLEPLDTVLMPNIKTVGKDELKAWFREDIPISIREKMGKPATFIGDKEAAVVPTLFHICRTTDYEEVFYDLINSYAIEYNPLESVDQNPLDNL